MTKSIRVGIVGHGSVGAVVVGRLRQGALPGVTVGGVLDPMRPPPAADAVADVHELLDRADVIVEAAGPAAVREIATPTLAAGRPLVVLSVGAFADPQMWQLLTEEAGLVICGGAIAGLDGIRAARLAGDIYSVDLVSTKVPGALIRPWMPPGQLRRIRALGPADPPLEVFSGSAPDAARLFPQNLNVAASLAIAAGSWEIVNVRLLADAAAEHTSHLIDVRAALGDYTFHVKNLPSPDNPATSGIVPFAVLRALGDLVGVARP